MAEKMDELEGMDSMDLEGLDLEEETPVGEQGDIDAFDSALETISNIFHRRMDAEEIGEPPMAPPAPKKFAPGMKRPTVSMKK